MHTIGLLQRDLHEAVEDYFKLNKTGNEGTA